MATLHITHNDLDGLGCAVLIKKFLRGNITTAYLGYDDIDEYIEENMYKFDKIIITDVSPDYGAVEMLAGEKDVVIIDHHVSSEPLKAFPFTFHDISKCATLLTYEWLISQGINAESYRDFAECVNDVDMWILKRRDSLHMNLLFNLMGIARMEERFLASAYDGFTETEQLLISLEEERRDAYIKKALRNAVMMKDRDGLSFCAVFAESYASELGNRIIHENGVDYVALINAQGRKVSLRSRKEVDIRRIAENNGGGGHKNAAAFSLKGEEFNLNTILSNMGII